MAAKSKNGGSGLLLLAGMGVGAFLLFNNKASGTAMASDSPNSTSADDDIPAAPKILAVNNASTESPLPTGIVSDEDGMIPTSSSSSHSSPAAPASSSDSWDDIPDAVPDTTSSSMPTLVSTKLTEKEKTIIQKGVLSDELAVKRPDLYKAIYVKKHGQKGKGQQALKAADSIIQRIKVKSQAKPATVHPKKRKVALKLNTKIAAKPVPSRKSPIGAKPTKAAPKPLILVTRPAPKSGNTAVKPHPVRPKVAAKRTAGKVAHKPVHKKTATRPRR